MVHKALAFAGTQAVEDLLLARRAKRNDAEYLGLPAGEDGGAMCARQQPYLATNGANGLEVASIGAHPVVQDIVAHIRFQLLFVEGDDVLQTIRILCAERGDQFALHCIERS